MSTALDRWRQEARSKGFDPDILEAKVKGRPVTQPSFSKNVSVPQSGGVRPRKTDKAPRVERDSQEGVDQSKQRLWSTLERIANSDLSDAEKRKQYKRIGVDERQVKRVLDGRADAADLVSSKGDYVSLEQRLYNVHGAPTNDAQRAYMATVQQYDAGRFAEQDRRRDFQLKNVEANLARLENNFERDEPWWMDVLLTFDKPRAAVVAGFSQLGAALDGDDKSVASWERFWDQYNNNVTVSSLMDENMNPWVRGVLGFAVDVALDPLTYLTGGSAAVAKVAGKGGVKAAQIAIRASDKATDAAEVAQKAGRLDDAARLTREAAEFDEVAKQLGTKGGYGGLDKSQRAVLERAAKSTDAISDAQTLRGGIYFRLPGTEGIRIPVASEMLQPVGMYSTRLVKRAGATKAGAAIYHPFRTQKRTFMRNFRSLDGKAQTDALAGLREVTLANVNGMRYSERMRSSLMGLQKRSDELGVDLTDGSMRRFLDAPTADPTNPIAVRVAAENGEGPMTELTQGWQRWWELARTYANDIVDDPNWLKQVDNYVYHRLNILDETADSIARSEGRDAFGLSGPEMQRAIQVDRVYRGVRIVEPEEAVALYGRSMSAEDQALEILRRQGVPLNELGLTDDVTGLFVDNMMQLSESYIRTVQARIVEKSTEMGLVSGAVAMTTKRKNLLSNGAALTAKERLLQRARFTGRVDQVAKMRAEALAAGLALPSTVGVDVAQTAAALGAVRTGALAPEMWAKQVADVAGLVGRESDQITSLLSRMDDLWSRFAKETERLFTKQTADQAWDLTLVGVSDSVGIQRIVGEMAGLEDELTALASGFVGRSGADLVRARGLLDQQVQSLQERLQFWVEVQDGLRSYRELPDQMRRLDAAVEVERVRNQLVHANNFLQVFNRVDDTAMRLTRFASWHDDNVVAVRRALQPDSDGVAKLANGEVAQFVRVPSDAGNWSAFDRFPRFTLTDDLDAADARMFGDMAGLPSVVSVAARTVDPSTVQRVGRLQVQVDEISKQIRRVEAEIADPSPNFFVEAKRSVSSVDPEMDVLARQIWDDPNFNEAFKEVNEQYKTAVELDEAISGFLDPTPEQLKVLGKQRLEQYKKDLFELEQEMVHWGATVVVVRGRGEVRWVVDTNMKGYAKKNVKGGYGKGKQRGGEYDWFDALDKSEQNFLSRNYFLSSDAGRGRGPRGRFDIGDGKRTPDGNAHSFMLENPEVAKQIELATPGTGGVDAYWENVLRLIGEHRQLKADQEYLAGVLRPRAGDPEEARAFLVQESLANNGQLREWTFYREQIPYSADQLRQIIVRVNELGADQFVGKTNLNPVYRGLQEAQQKAASQLLDAQRLAKREAAGLGSLFDFGANVSRPLNLTGPNAEAQMLADMLVTSVRNKIIPMGTGPITTTDQALWNQVSQLVNVAARQKAVTTADLDILVQHTNRLIGQYARLDDTSAAARLLAASDNPAGQMFDEIVNVGSLTANERLALGDWDDMLAPMRHSPDQVASSYRKRLAAGGFDGVMLDDGSVRQLVSLTPQSMRPNNAASKIVLKILNEQQKMLSQLGKMQSSKVKLVDQWGINPESATSAVEAAAATQRANAKRVRKLAGRQGAGKQLSQTDQDELLFRRSAQDLFEQADGAEQRAQKLLDDHYNQHLQDTAVAARTEGLVPAEYRRPPELQAQADQLRLDADNMRLIAQADAADADALVAGFGRGYDTVFTGNLAEKPGLAEDLSALLTQGLKQFSGQAWAPEDVVDNLRKLAQIVQPDEVRKFLKGWDYLTGLFKTYAVATPGFTNRNLVGGAMNNWLGLVNVKSYGEFLRADRLFHKTLRDGGSWDDAFAAVRKKYGARSEDAFRTWMEVAPAVAGGQAASFAGDVGITGTNAIRETGIGRAMVGKGLRDQGLTDNTVTRGFFYANQRSEYMLRGPVVWDEIMRKGGDKASAVDRVYALHFDYSAAGMSKFERGTLKRLVPFYVWMANNVPLQLKGLVTRPKVAASYIKLKNSFEALTDDEGVVPEYFGRLAAIRLPFTNDGLGQYFMPDLPFRDLGVIKGLPALEAKSLNPFDAAGQVLDWDELLASINPMARVPVETLLMQRKVFTGAPFRDSFVEMPRSFKIPGVPQALKFMGQADQDAEGNWWINEKTAYSVESNLPLVNRINRLFPSTEAGKEKTLAVWLSTFLGVGFRANTRREQSNQLFKMQDELDKFIRQQTTLGRVVPTKGELDAEAKQRREIEQLGGYTDVTPYLLDVINSGDSGLLAELNGFGESSASELVSNVELFGEFTDIEDLVSAKGVSADALERALVSLREQAYRSLDFESASIADLEAMPGIGPKTAPKVSAYAKANGGVNDLYELVKLGVPRKRIPEIAAWLDEQRQFQQRVRGVFAQ